MAEVYGEKPKMFTKEWWPYYWLYYKWHTIAVLFVIMLVVIALVECTKKEKYDLRITTLGEVYMDPDGLDKVEKALEGVINDIDGNGKKNIEIMSLTIVDDKEYTEQNYTSNLKHDIEFSDSLMYVFIYDKKQLDENAENGFLQEAFYETDEWLEDSLSDDLFYCDANNKSYAVSLKNSSILKDAGIDGENLYVLVKNDKEAVDKNPKARKNAIIIANKLIK